MREIRDDCTVAIQTQLSIACEMLLSFVRVKYITQTLRMLC